MCVCEGDIFAKSNHDSREEIGDGRNTYVIIFNERHNSSGLQRGRGKNEHLQITREDRNVSLTPHPQCSNHSKKICTYHFIISSMEIVPVPETSFVARDVSDLAFLVLEVWLPDQRAISEDP